jgi:hypothetical protein
MLAAVIGFVLTTAPAQTAAPASSTPVPSGGPTHYGHTMISAGALTPAAAGALNCPLTVSGNCLGSYNWAGYAVASADWKTTKVVADWTVPTITGSTASTCPDAQKTWDSNSVWIGIDGLFSPSVEQTGTSSDCFYGQTSYYAWYEFYPAGSVVSSNTVSPGDHISATVTYMGNNTKGYPTFKTTLDDLTAGWTFSSPKTAAPDALMNSAEWIDESPYYEGFLGLTHVGSVAFSYAKATIGGVTAVIGSWPAGDIYWLNSVDYNWPYDEVLAYTKAVPGALNSAGNGFKVTWESDGP